MHSSILWLVVDRADFQHLPADIGDEAAVGGAAGWSKVRSRYRRYHGWQPLRHQPAGHGRSGRGGRQRSIYVVIQPVLVQNGAQAVLQASGVLAVESGN